MVDEKDLEEITSDFECFVCGAVFTTEQDKRQHLEKEMHGAASRQDVETVKRQTELGEMHRQSYESV